MSRQRIIIEINGHYEEPYELLEQKGGGRTYEALRHFFTDIGFEVEKLELSTIEEPAT